MALFGTRLVCPQTLFAPACDREKVNSLAMGGARSLELSSATASLHRPLLIRKWRREWDCEKHALARFSSLRPTKNDGHLRTACAALGVAKRPAFCRTRVRSPHPLAHKQRPHKGAFVYGGGSGIRTHDTLLAYTHFPGVRLRPLGHPSAGSRENNRAREAMQPAIRQKMSKSEGVRRGRGVLIK